MSTEEVNEQPVNQEPDEGEQAPPSPDEGSQESEFAKVVGFKPDAVNNVINKKHREAQEAREAAAEAERRAQEYREKLEKLENQGPPEIPELPDPFDADYEQKIAARDAAIQKNVEYQQQQAFQQQQAEVEQQQARARQQQQAQQTMKGYQERVQALGLKQDEQIMAEQVVASYLQDPSLRSFLLSDENGPLMVRYLSDNPIVLNDVAAMDPISAGVHLKTVISPEAQKLKPATTQTPDPAEIPGGRGKPEPGRYPMSAGATFE